MSTLPNAQVAAYRLMLAETGEMGQWDRWRDHMDDLKNGVRTVPPPSWQRQSPKDLQKFWQDKFTQAEIAEMNGSLYLTTREVEGKECPRLRSSWK